MSSYEKWSLAVTVIGVFVGIGVLFVYAFQLKAMKASVNAAMLNAKAFIESQRPQIAAKAHGNPTHTLEDRQAPRVELSLSNRGTTPAYDLIYESWIEILPPPFIDFTPSADYFKSSELMVLYPNHDPIIINLPIRGGLTEQQLSDLRQRCLYACIRVRVQYRDAFSPPSRYANFGFIVFANGLGYLPKYNDAGQNPN